MMYAKADRGLHAADGTLRLLIARGEVVRLPQACAKVQVLAGRAWVSWAGEDRLLTAGEAARFDPRDAAVVSDAAETPVVLEVKGEENERCRHSKRISWIDWLRTFADRWRRGGKASA